MTPSSVIEFSMVVRSTKLDNMVIMFETSLLFLSVSPA